MAKVHPTAIIGPEAELAPDVSIGPWCVLEGRVRLGAGVSLVAQVHLSGPVEIGAGTTLYPGACIGLPPQDVKFKIGDPTAGVVIGSNCIIREHATVHAATKTDVPTRVGDNVFMMVNTHLGHDARVGNRVVLVNNTALAGHSSVDDQATLSGAVLVHQFTRIGRLAFISGGTPVPSDVPPFCVAAGRDCLSGINRIGMRRAGMERDEIDAVWLAFRTLFARTTPREELIAGLDAIGASSPAVREMAAFVRGCARRSIMAPPGRPPAGFLRWLKAARVVRSVDAVDDGFEG